MVTHDQLGYAIVYLRTNRQNQERILDRGQYSVVQSLFDQDRYR